MAEAGSGPKKPEVTPIPPIISKKRNTGSKVPKVLGSKVLGSKGYGSDIPGFGSLNDDDGEDELPEASSYDESNENAAANFCSNIIAIRQAIVNEGLIEALGKNNAEEIRKLVETHKNMIEDTLRESEVLSNKKVKAQIHDLLVGLMPEEQVPLVSEEDARFNELSPMARMRIARHNMALGIADLDPRYLKFACSRLDTAIVGPTTLEFLQKNGLYNGDHRSVIRYLAYCNRVLKFLYVRGVFELLKIVYTPATGPAPANVITDDNIYVLVMDALYNLCNDACRCIHDNETFFNAVVDRISSYDWSDFYNALTKAGALVVGVASADFLYPGLFGGIGTLFNYGKAAIMITATSQLVSPELMILVASDVIVHPVSLFQRIKRGVTGARASGAAVFPDTFAPPLQGEPSTAELFDRVALSLQQVNPQPPTVFCDGTMAGDVELAVRSCWRRGIEAIGMVVHTMVNPSAIQAVKITASTISGVFTDFATMVRDDVCVRKGSAPNPTNDMKLALIRLLYKNPAYDSDPRIRQCIDLVAECLSYDIQLLNASMLALFEAYQHKLTTGFGEKSLVKPDVESSQGAVYDPSHESQENRDAEVALPFFKEVDPDMAVPTSEREPAYEGPVTQTQLWHPKLGGIEDLIGWLRLSGVKLDLRVHTPWRSVDELKKLYTPQIIQLIQGMLPPDPSQSGVGPTWVGRDVKDMDEIHVAYVDFLAYVIREEQKRELKHREQQAKIATNRPLEVASAVQAVVANIESYNTTLAEIAPCRGGSDPTGVEGSGSDTEGGKSRTRRRRAATTKRSRRKAYNKKSNKRKSRKQLSRKKISRRRQSRRK
jgi:hypothetical protein